MPLQQTLQLPFLEYMVVSVVYHRLLLHVDLRIRMINLLQILLVLKVQVPRNKHILLCELFLTHTLLPVVERPYVNQSFSPNPRYPHQLLDCLVPNFLVREVMNNCN